MPNPEDQVRFSGKPKRPIINQWRTQKTKYKSVATQRTNNKSVANPEGQEKKYKSVVNPEDSIRISREMQGVKLNVVCLPFRSALT